MASSKEALLALVRRRKSKEVEIDGVRFTVRDILNVDTFDKYRELLEVGKKKEAMTQLFLDCIVDEKGDRLLNEAEAGEVAASMDIFPKLVDAIMEVSGLPKEVAGEKKSEAG